MMNLFTSKKERLLWLTTFFVVVGIFSTIGLAGQFADFFIRQELFGLLFILGFILTGSIIVTFGLRNKSRPIEWLLYLVVFLILIMIFARSGVSLVERTHLFEYGIVSVLLFNAMLERNSSILKASIYAFLMTTLLGSIDEVIQYYLPVRVFDWLDIVRNISAGLIGIFVNSLFLLMRKKLSSSRIDSSS